MSPDQNCIHVINSAIDDNIIWEGEEYITLGGDKEGIGIKKNFKTKNWLGKWESSEAECLVDLSNNQTIFEVKIDNKLIGKWRI